MVFVVLKMLLIVSVSAQLRKHVYVNSRLSWNDAQRHCRENYTDLSPVTTSFDEERLKIATNTASWNFWIGLYRENNEWRWSGGGPAIDIPWAAGETGDQISKSAAAMCPRRCEETGWYSRQKYHRHAFFCINLIVEKVKKTWEEALEHCRETHTDLTSLHSETEKLLALREMNQSNIIEPVWIGLRFLGDRWLWLDGDPLVYEAWPKGGRQDHQCPIRKRCAALTKEGMWENRECQEKLSMICY